MRNPTETLAQATLLAESVLAETVLADSGSASSGSGESIGVLDDAALCALTGQVEQLGRFVDTLRAVTAAQIEERSRYGLGSESLAQKHGLTRGIHLIERITRISQTEASRRVKVGKAITPRHTLDGRPLDPDYPVVAAAMRAGTVGLDAAAAVTRILDQAAPRAEQRAIDTAEADLVSTATQQSADLVSVRARVWRELLDPDGAQPRDTELRERRAFRLGRERHGLTTFSGAADPVFAAKLRAVFSEASAPGAKPRFLSPEDETAGTDTRVTPEGETITTVRDTRTREQRQADVVEGLLTAGMRANNLDRPGMRSTATVSVMITLDDLKNGTGAGWIDDTDEPISVATVQKLICDAGYNYVVLGPEGQILYFGHTKRFFSTGQKQALARRDGGCIITGCTAPPEWCDAHHVDEVAADHGTTNIGNGVLLCGEHHAWIHNSDYQLRMIRGMPYLLAPPEIDPSQTPIPLGKSRIQLARQLRKTG